MTGVLSSGFCLHRRISAMAYGGVFEAFFLNADADRDGRISGVEAINFFRAADLSQPTLAKIWEYANQSQTGFLSRQEFYNALKLATVAQTGRELTPELVKAALSGPAAAQIPPPRMLEPIQDLDLQSSAPFSASRRLSLDEGSVAMRHHLLKANCVPSSGNVPRAGATRSSSTTSCVPSETVKLIPSSSVGLSVDSCSKPSTGGLSTARALQNALDSASNAPCTAANAPNFREGTQFAKPANTGPPKSSSNPELYGFGELSRTNSLVGDMTANCGPRSLPASSLGLSKPTSSVIMTSNPRMCGYDGRQLGAAAPAPPNSPWPKMTPSDAQRFVHVFSQRC